jgi:glyoxylase-like metal-dependent hydrolase (beta-lactamase superfamily II)
MIADAVSNIGVQIGEDGVVLVNAGTQEASGEVLTAIKKLTKEPIRYIINTSADADLVGGNRTLSKAGVGLRGGRALGADDAALIMAHENVLQRMRKPSGTTPPFPSEAWPNESFDERRKYMSFNDEGIEILHQPAAHTDGDTVVFFRRSDVVVAGHILDATRFPVIDVARGGSIKGEIDALNRLIELAIPAGVYSGNPNGAIATSVAVLPGEPNSNGAWPRLPSDRCGGASRHGRDHHDTISHDRPENDARAVKAAAPARRASGVRATSGWTTNGSSRPSTRA